MSGTVGQQVFVWNNIDLGLCRRMASQGHNDLERIVNICLFLSILFSNWNDIDCLVAVRSEIYSCKETGR